MVVGEDKSLVRDDLARAAAAEDDDGILERGVVHRVDILGRETASLGPHILDVHLLKVGQKPHTLIGAHGTYSPYERQCQ